MKGRMLALLALAAFLLAACTTPPITVGLSDVAVDLTVAADSAGKVLFPADPLAVKNPLPATRVASVTIQGEARLKNPAEVSFDVYATDTSPKDLDCAQVGSVLTGYFYACDAKTKGIAKVSRRRIDFGGRKGPVAFTLSGDLLASGINKQSLYLGTVIQGATAGNVLYLEHLTATVQLAVGQ